jgi:mobilome CxxCx(11)CxxC protein
MLDQAAIDSIRQQKLNALSSIYLHEKYIRKLQKKNLLVEFLTIAVPVFYIVPRFLVKGTIVATFVETVWEVAGAVLLVLAIFKVVYKWQDREIRHSVMLRRNADINQEANQLLSRGNITNEVFEQFSRRVLDIDAEDRELLLDTKKNEEQEACREALKNAVPGSTMLCPKCGADPWLFKPGSCGACGGTPSKYT